MNIIKKIDFDPEFEPLLNFSPLIEHEVLDGLERSGQILKRARLESSRLRKKAREILVQANVEREEERKRGFEEGRQEGLSTVTERILTLELAHKKMLEVAESEILHMVMEITEKVIGREVKEGAVVSIVQKAIKQATGRKVTVRVHPGDLVFIREREEEFLSGVDKTRAVSVVEDEGVAVGGCVVETELEKVDARLETQLAAIRKALGLCPLLILENIRRTSINWRP